MDKRYEILDHPADLKIKALGKNLPEVFVNMALAVAEQSRPSRKAGPAQVQAKEPAEEITVESDDQGSLLVDWLSEILYRGEVNKKIYTDFEIMEFSEKLYKIKAKIRGVAVKSKNIDIKAVTYHELEIKKVDDHWEAIVVFDI